MAHNRRDLLAFKQVAARYGYTFAGRTKRGHFRWEHPTLPTLFTSSDLAFSRSRENAERDMRIASRRDKGAPA